MSKGNDALFERFSFDLSKKYGEGGYGATFSAADAKTKEPLAVKIIDSRRMKPDAIKKECQILEVLTHPNVISVKGHGLGVGDKAHLYFIFMELAGGGELFDKVIENGANAMTEAVARNYFCQMLDGVAYCHLAGVAHRDLKLENVLLNSAGVVKLIDFGLSHVYPRLSDGSIDRSRPLKDVCGSKSYAAPEVMAARGYDGYAADMWSLGVCLFAMLSGFFPLDEASVNDWRFPKLVSAQREKRSTTEVVYGWYKRSVKHLSREVVHLLDSLLATEPSQRMTMAAVREHPWVREQKFGGAAAQDQGSFYASELVSDDAMQYRGFNSGMPDFADAQTQQVIMDDDDVPVYRSLGGMVGTGDMLGDEDAAAPLAPLPMLCRQKAKSNWLGLAALDAMAAP